MLLWLFSHSVMSDSLQPHGLQHASLPCPSLSPGDCSHSCPLSHCCHPTILSSVVRVFSSESALHIRWSKYWSFSFSISSSNECSGLVSFRIDWFDLLAVQESSPTPQLKSINSSALSLFHDQLSHPYKSTEKKYNSADIVVGFFSHL